MPQTIIVSPCLTIADPSEVEIDPTEIDTGRKVVKLDLPSGLKPYNKKKQKQLLEQFILNLILKYKNLIQLSKAIGSLVHITLSM